MELQKWVVPEEVHINEGNHTGFQPIMNDIDNHIQDVHIHSKNNGIKKTVNIANHFYTWKFGSINIRIGK